jgi:hypothetical protein
MSAAANTAEAPLQVTRADPIEQPEQAFFLRPAFDLPERDLRWQDPFGCAVGAVSIGFVVFGQRYLARPEARRR